MEQGSGQNTEISNSDIQVAESNQNAVNDFRSNEHSHGVSRLQSSASQKSYNPQALGEIERIAQRKSNTGAEIGFQESLESKQNLFSVGKTGIINSTTSEVLSKYTDLIGNRIQIPITHVGIGSYNTSFGAALSRPAPRPSGYLNTAGGSITRELGGTTIDPTRVINAGSNSIPISTGAGHSRISHNEELSSVGRVFNLQRVASDSTLPFPTRLDNRSRFITGGTTVVRQYEQETGGIVRQGSAYQPNVQINSPPPEQVPTQVFRVSSPNNGATSSNNMQAGTWSTTHTTVHPGRIISTNETLYEHPPVVKSMVERPSIVYSPTITGVPASRVLVTGQPFVTGGYATVTERVVSSGSMRESHFGHSTAVRNSTVAVSGVNNSELLTTIQKQKEQIEELEVRLSKSESHESSLTASLRRTVETLQNRQSDLDERLKKTTLERDELLFKLEGREDAQGSLKEKVYELESELRLARAKSQRIEGDLASITAERTELEATIRKLMSEHSSRQLSADMNSNEALNRLKISEERCRHLEKRNLDLEDELLKISREFKEFRERAGVSNNDRSTIVRPVLTGLDGVDQHSHNSVLAQLKEKSLLADEFRLKFEAAEQRANRAERSLADLQRLLDSERSSFQNQLQAKETEKKGLKTKLADQQTKYDELSAQFSNQRSLIENLNRQIEALRAKLKAAEDENEHLKKERASLAADKKQLELKCQSLELENQRLHRSLDGKTQELHKLESDCQAKQEKVASLIKSLTEAQQTIADLQSKIKQLESMISRLERELEGKASPEEISAPLQAEISRLEELLQALREELRQKTEELELRTEEYETTLLKAEERINSLAKQVEELEAAKNKAESDLLSLQEVSEKFICDNHTLQTERDALREEVLMLQEQLEHQGGLMLDGALVSEINQRIIKLLQIIRSKDEEIQELYSLADGATKVANERLLEVEATQHQHSKLMNNVAFAFEELSKVGVKASLDPLQQESAR
jgi:predicted  nucleic acid-binding Zn-ribbon protein